MTTGREEARSTALSSIENVLASGAEADEMLRLVVGRLGFTLYVSVAIAFLDDGALTVGPTHGSEPATCLAVPVLFQEAPIAEIRVSPALDEDRPFLERVARRISLLCLVGWDTGGVPWDEL